MPHREIRAASISASRARSCSARWSPTPASYQTGNPWLGVLAAGVAGLVLGAMHGYICKLPKVNDIAVGIAMMSFGTGLAFFFGKPYIQPTAPRLDAIPLGGWTGNPRLAQALQVNPLFFVGIALAVFMWWALAQHPLGPDRAHDRRQRRRRPRPWASRSISVRFLATAAGGFLAGIGGAFLSLYYPGSLEPGPVVRAGPDGGGAGDLRALGPDPLRLAALLFGAAGALGPALQSVGITPGLLLLQRRALHPDALHHDRLGPARRVAAREVPGELSITK